MFQVTTALPPAEEAVVPKLPLIQFEGQLEEEDRMAALAEAQKIGGKDKKQKGAKADGEMSNKEKKRLAKKAKIDAMGGEQKEGEEKVEEKVVEKKEEIG